MKVIRIFILISNILFILLSSFTIWNCPSLLWQFSYLPLGIGIGGTIIGLIPHRLAYIIESIFTFVSCVLFLLGAAILFGRAFIELLGAPKQQVDKNVYDADLLIGLAIVSILCCGFSLVGFIKALKRGRE
jgi:hypothetical protein